MAEFLGQGFKFPLRLNGRVGLSYVSGEQSITEAIWLIISTPLRSRIMEPEFGCNIHDYMQAYIYVSESNLVAVSNEAGQLQWPDIAPGEYQLYMWHPWQLAEQQPNILKVVMPVQTESVELAIDLTQQKPQAPQRGFGTR